MAIINTIHEWKSHARTQWLPPGSAHRYIYTETTGKKRGRLLTVLEKVYSVFFPRAHTPGGGGRIMWRKELRRGVRIFIIFENRRYHMQRTRETLRSWLVNKIVQINRLDRRLIAHRYKKYLWIILFTPIVAERANAHATCWVEKKHNNNRCSKDEKNKPNDRRRK